ncbi:MAG: acetyl-CoA carboxylase carboxyl transferase subunit alpha, partial [Treponema sp.]|nr:acetyl-CoA carboxylase carboxyl transferase subunit alpha [Treponema sp.]
MIDIEEKVEELKKLLASSGIDALDELVVLEEKVRSQSKVEGVWKQVELARHPERPYSLDYIDRIFDGFIELHGDRAYADDPAIVGGIGFLGSR